MGLLRRPTPASRIDGFWTWWTDSGRTMMLTALDRKDFEDASPVLTEQVLGIDPALEWHLSRGLSASHALTLSAVSDARARATAERWRRSAPADADWEFRSAKAADPAPLEGELRFGAQTVGLADLGFRVEDSGRRIDVTVGHVAFRDLPGDLPHRVAFLALDWLLGEDLVARWIGAVDVSPNPGPSTAEMLREAVHRRDAARDPEAWTMMSGELRNKPLVAMLRVTPDRFDVPTHDLHTAVSIRYRADRDGLPLDVAALQQQEDTFADIPGALLVAVETTGGTRTMHLYSDSLDVAATDRLAAAAKAIGRKVTTRIDSAWEGVRHLMP